MADKLLNMINDPANAVDQLEAVDEPEVMLEPTPNVEMKYEEVEEEEEEEEAPKPTKRQLFEIPEDEQLIPKKETPKQKKKRVMSEAQLLNLKKARQASAIKRKELKEVKEMEKATKKIEMDQKKQEKINKKMEAEAMIEMKARMKKEATNEALQEATWDEDRISLLMEKTLDNYIAKRKKEKAPTSRQTLVAPQPHTQPQQQYQQQPQQPMYYPPQQQQYRQPKAQNGYDDNPFARFMN